ncbi:MAG: O-methyltransferase [Sandaracinaceae bacterium]
MSDPIEMSEARWRYTSRYLRETFGRPDAQLAGLMKRAVAAGLPDIAVSADVGRLLMMLTSMTRGQLAVELGTLAGYSAIWLARGLRSGGRLITVEPVAQHADFAERELSSAGLKNVVEVRRERGLEALARLRQELPDGAVDVLFVDAIKSEYPAYFEAARALIAPGGLVLADNALGSSQWWIDDEDHPYRKGADALNRMLADDPDFEAVGIPIREGLLVARRVR